MVDCVSNVHATFVSVILNSVLFPMKCTITCTHASTVTCYYCVCVLLLFPDEVYHSDFHRDSDKDDDEDTDNDYSLADSGYSGTGSSPLSHESRYVLYMYMHSTICACACMRMFCTAFGLYYVFTVMYHLHVHA